jgi:hypothetical protein
MRLALTIGSVLLLAASGVARADEGPAISALSVSLWPEYDRAQMLVMIEGILDPAETLPKTVVVPVPKAAGDPHAVAKGGGPDRPPLLAKHRLERGEVWTLVHLDTEMSRFRVEYYAPLVRDGEAREYRFEWPGTGSALGNVAYEVRLPTDGQDVVIDPPPAQVGTMPGGQPTHQGWLGGVSAGGSFAIDVGYTRSTDALAATPQGMVQVSPSGVPAVAPVKVTEPTKGESNTWWMFPAILGAVALVGAYLMTMLGRGGAEGSD